MAVTGYSGAYIAVLIGGNTFKWTYLPRDEEIISMLIRLERVFWNHVEDGVPPNVDGSEASAEYLLRQYPVGNAGTKITLPDEAADLIRQYGEARELADRYTEEKRLAENKLKQMLGTNEVGTIGSHSIRWSTVSQDRFDSKAFQTEQPELYKQYLKSNSHRRLTIKAAG